MNQYKDLIEGKGRLKEDNRYAVLIEGFAKGVQSPFG
jgi:hypothetical protein